MIMKHERCVGKQQQQWEGVPSMSENKRDKPMLRICDQWYAKKIDDLNWALLQQRTIAKVKSGRPSRIGEKRLVTISYHARLEDALVEVTRAEADAAQVATVHEYIEALQAVISRIRLLAQEGCLNGCQCATREQEGVEEPL